jgi:hypothetical protein
VRPCTGIVAETSVVGPVPWGHLYSHRSRGMTSAERRRDFCHWHGICRIVAKNPATFQFFLPKSTQRVRHRDNTIILLRHAGRDLGKIIPKTCRNISVEGHGRCQWSQHASGLGLFPVSPYCTDKPKDSQTINNYQYSKLRIKRSSLIASERGCHFGVKSVVVPKKGVLLQSPYHCAVVPLIGNSRNSKFVYLKTR